jgi:hypothetical protein
LLCRDSIVPPIEAGRQGFLPPLNQLLVTITVTCYHNKPF